MSIKLIEYLPDLQDGTILAMSVKSGAPATDKLVILQVVSDKGSVDTIGARYREGRWYGESAREDITEEVMSSSNAVWAESFLFTESSAHQHVNSK